jgi:hypothetical protein
LVSLRQTLAQRLGQDVVVPFSTLRDDELVILLISLVDGLIRNTYSGDTLFLSFAQAQDTCKKYGLDAEEVSHVLDQIGGVSEKLRQQNPIARALF